jgi:uncharacterized protein (TIGR00156 family)
VKQSTGNGERRIPRINNEEGGTLMKKASVLIVAVVLVVADVAIAQFTGAGAGGANTVAEVKQMRDESKVILEGYIVKQLGSEHYTFRDDTGEIEVEIDDDEWRGQIVGPETKIRIDGEVDRDSTSVTVEVERLRIISGNGGQSGGFRGK